MNQSIVSGTDFSQVDINIAYVVFRNAPRESHHDVMHLMSRECWISKKVREIYRTKKTNPEKIQEYMQVLAPYVSPDTLERNQ